MPVTIIMRKGPKHGLEAVIEDLKHINYRRLKPEACS